MTQYTDIVARQKLLLDAEEWSKGIEKIHCHKTSRNNLQKLHYRFSHQSAYHLTKLFSYINETI